jgi:hypothetical protein
VQYADEYMIIQGDDGEQTVFWVFKKGQVRGESE